MTKCRALQQLRHRLYYWLMTRGELEKLTEFRSDSWKGRDGLEGTDLLETIFVKWDLEE